MRLMIFFVIHVWSRMTVTLFIVHMRATLLGCAKISVARNGNAIDNWA